MRKRIASVSLPVFLLAAVMATVPAGRSSQRGLTIAEGRFVLDGKAFQIISGEMHYARIPREYWRHRLKLAKAMGLNAITTYVFWNLHEPQPGTYEFTGQQDVAAFIRMAQEEGLYVILRPGPYVCSEWDLGGLPAWLLADPGIVLRSTDEKFMGPAEKWIARLGRELAGLQFAEGGPIIAVQVENEYGSFDSDTAYMRRIYDALRRAGFNKSLLYTADGPAQLGAGTLPDVPAAVNLGPGNAKHGLEILAKFHPGQPLMLGEWWAGWFDHWGRPHHVTDGEKEASELDWVLSKGYSISIYMFHGGTSWGFFNGANSDEGGYWPQVSSYDYSAAVDESGRPTKKYFLFRDVIAKRTGQTLPAVPAPADIIEIPAIRLDQVAPLFKNLPRAIERKQPVNMEALGQSYGYILYRTEVRGPVEGELAIHDVRDYAQIYLNGKLVGTLDRRLAQDRLPISVLDKTARLDILVENTGRINFTKALREERKGITKDVTLSGKVLSDWQIFCLPMTDLSAFKYARAAATRPAFYRGTFRLKKTGDTFLHFGKWSKGTAWVNGHHLGRFWKIGPQQTLYLPGPWLKQGENEIVVFDLEPMPKPEVSGLREPVLGDLREPHPSLKKN
jgi:beta-galactosidase